MDLVLEQKIIDAVTTVSVLLIKDFKDGVQATDFADIAAKIMANEELKAQLLEIYNSVDQVKGDVKAMTAVEWIKLASYVMPKIVELVAAIRA